MNLLLLLSAMLSALTGAMTGTRAEAPRQVAAASVAAVAESAARTSVETRMRPAVTLPTLTAVAATSVIVPIIVTGLPQPYASRRRE